KNTTAASIGVLNLIHDAEATVQSGARINQNIHGATGTDNFRSGNQDVVVGAASVNEAVNLAGDFKTPTVGGTKPSHWIQGDYSAKGLGMSAAPGGSAQGGSVGFYWYGNAVQATIEDGVALYADSLKVTADTLDLAIVLAAAGGKADASAVNGTVA